MATVITTADLVARLAYLKKSGTPVRAVLAYSGGDVDILGVVTGATIEDVRIGGSGYELLVHPAALISVDRETPLDSGSPAAARAAEHGEVRAQILETKHIEPRAEFFEQAGAQLMTDEGYAQTRFSENFVHDYVNHEIEYVHGNVHTNSVENFWALLQRTLGGTYVSVEPFHFAAYVDEQAFRFNTRKNNDGLRFGKA